MKPKQVIVITVSMVLFLGLTLFLAAQDDPAEDKGAEKSHRSLKKLPSSILTSLGLSEEDAAQSTRGPKLKVYMLGLDKLKSFKSGGNAKKILVDTKETVFPIYVGKELRTSISIRKGEGGWKNASMGGTEIQLLEPIRNTHSRINNIDAKFYFIVRVPAMYLSFLGYGKGKTLYLIPTRKHPELDFPVGKSVPAEDVYMKIQPLEAKYRNVLIRRKQ
jgi:hypothetical protein